jgi:hypothetical protein
MSSTRPIWLHESLAQRFVDIAYKLHQIGESTDAGLLMDLSEKVDSAPADAHDVAFHAMLEDGRVHYPEEALTVLRALGRPDE